MTSIEWIEKHGEPYVGSWVALKEGQLVGVARTRKALLYIVQHMDRSELLITRLV